jgi:hypothetical protein
MLGDPDSGLVLREDVRKRLLLQKRAVARGPEENRSKQFGIVWA